MSAMFSTPGTAATDTSPSLIKLCAYRNCVSICLARCPTPSLLIIPRPPEESLRITIDNSTPNSRN
eukprot:9987796-Prorocentrum_lima.AAC.1